MRQGLAHYACFSCCFVGDVSWEGSPSMWLVGKSPHAAQITSEWWVLQFLGPLITSGNMRLGSAIRSLRTHVGTNVYRAWDSSNIWKVFSHLKHVKSQAIVSIVNLIEKAYLNIIQMYNVGLDNVEIHLHPGFFHDIFYVLKKKKWNCGMELGLHLCFL